jgi:hypothetical protein
LPKLPSPVSKGDYLKAKIRLMDYGTSINSGGYARMLKDITDPEKMVPQGVLRQQFEELDAVLNDFQTMV